MKSERTLPGSNRWNCFVGLLVSFLCPPLLSLLLACQKQSGVTAENAPSAAYILPISPRLQWQTENGYCGEASIQATGLHYGAWISQRIIRKAAGGELLLGENETRALDALHLRYEVWDSGGQTRPEFCAFTGWLKAHLQKGVPCITAVYLEGFSHSAYDHIVPVVGVVCSSKDPECFDPTDELIYHNLFSAKPIKRTFQSLVASRDQCRVGLMAGGSIPEQVCYGVAITGMADPEGIALPLRLTVDRPDEPNSTQGKQSIGLRGLITVSSLHVGDSYSLFRYDRIEDLPTHGGSKAILQSRYSTRINFIATGTSWNYSDPRYILSSGATYYRCIPSP